MTRLLFVPLLVCAAPAAAQTSYVSVQEDLPLAPGLVEIGRGFQFEDANGRVVGAAARGDVAAGAVRNFYLETLPALGWSYSPVSPAMPDELVFLRGRERLALAIAAADGGSELQLRLFVRSEAD